MGRVLTNQTGLQIARESSIAVLPAEPLWKMTEPNDIGEFGAETTTVPRDPISVFRQRRKGAVTDLDSSVGYDADLTLDSFLDYIDAFCFATPSVNTLYSDTTGTGAQRDNLQAVNALTLAGNPEGFSHDALDVVIPAGTLIYTRGFSMAANNGLFEVDTGGSVTETPITTTPGIVDEDPTLQDNASLEIAGFAFTDLTWTDATNTIGSAATDFTTLPWQVGQLIHIGGIVASTQFGTLGEKVAYGRIIQINAATVVLDKVSGTLKDLAADEGAAAVHVLTGRFIKNVPVGTTGDDHLFTSAERKVGAFLEQSFSVEAAWVGLIDPIPDTGYEYADGNFCNTMAWAMPLTDKATVTFGLIGTTAASPVATRRQNGAIPLEPVQSGAFNTSSDFIRLRVQNEAQSSILTAFFTDLTFTMNNNVSPEKVLGTLGAAFMNAGNFNVTLEGEIVFTSELIIEAIRNNTTLTFDFIVFNDDGAISIDLPSLTLGGGARNLTRNESVRVSLTGDAFADSTFNTSIGVTVFPIVPAPVAA